MKKILLMCLLFIAFATVCNAQKSEQGKFDPKEKAKILQKQLKLTDDQTVKVTAIYSESANKFDKIKASEKGNTNKMMGPVRVLKNETIAKVKGVLEARQVIAYDKLVKQQSSDTFGGWASGQSDAYN